MGELGGMKAPELLIAAANLVAGDRAADHGDMRKVHKDIAILWTAYLKTKGVHTHIKPSDVADMMALLKIARTQNGKHNPDDRLDAAGYIAIAEQIHQSE